MRQFIDILNEDFTSDWRSQPGYEPKTPAWRFMLGYQFGIAGKALQGMHTNADYILGAHLGYHRYERHRLKNELANPRCHSHYRDYAKKAIPILDKIIAMEEQRAPHFVPEVPADPFL
jgi:hypothetical protein